MTLNHESVNYDRVFVHHHPGGYWAVALERHGFSSEQEAMAFLYIAQHISMVEDWQELADEALRRKQQGLSPIPQAFLEAFTGGAAQEDE